jgi:hypothetical protein
MRGRRGGTSLLGMSSTVTTPVTPDLLRGCLETEHTEVGLLPHRLPAWARAQSADPQVGMVEAQSAGVRLVFRSRTTAVELVTLPTRRALAGVPRRPDGVYDLVVDGRLVDQGTVTGGRTMTIDPASGSVQVDAGPVGTLRFRDLGTELKTIEIWLPYSEQTELVALRTDAPVEPAGPSGRRTWLHHGSSISQGSNAASPTGTWPAVAAARGQVELINLGLGGSALLDPYVGRVLRDTPADLISVKLGINLVNTDLMRVRALGPAVHGLLDTIRDGHPQTPLVLISPVLCPIHEDTPGPAAVDLAELAQGRLAFTATGDPADVERGRLTLTSIRAELARVVQQRSADDPHLHHLDGRRLYGEDDTDAMPLLDRLHPGPAAHRLMGERFAAHAFDAPDAPFRRP